MSFAKRLLPPEQEAEQPNDQGSIQHGLSLEDAILEFVKINSEYEQLGYRKKCVLEVLLPAAFEVRGESNTTRLTSSDQKTQLKVEFGNTYKCDPDRLNTVKDLLGDDVFESLFKVEYSPKQRGLKPFLASKSTDERIETAKGIIREAITALPKSPQVTIEKGKNETPF